MEKIADKITDIELASLVKAQRKMGDAQRAAEEAALAAQDARTEFEYALMQLRKKYRLKFGDRIDDANGAITRS